MCLVLSIESLLMAVVFSILWLIHLFLYFIVSQSSHSLHRTGSPIESALYRRCPSPQQAPEDGRIPGGDNTRDQKQRTTSCAREKDLIGRPCSCSTPAEISKHNLKFVVHAVA